MKKMLSILLSIVMIFGISILPAAAKDTSQTYSLTLSANGEQTVSVAPGEEVTLQLTLDRTDQDGDFPMYAFTSVIRYSSTMLELVDSDVLTGVDMTETALSGTSWIGWNDLTFNALAKNWEGDTWSDPVVIASLTFKAKSYGSSVMMFRRAEVSTFSGMDSFVCETSGAQIVVKDSTDYTGLNQALNEAQEDLDGTKISKDGSDVSPSDKWVTQEAADLLKAAIESGREKASQTDATQMEIYLATSAVNAAVTAFDESKKAGTKSDGGGGGVTPVTPTTKYKVVMGETANGTASADAEEAEAGTPVYITVSPETGYQVDQVTVTSGDSAVEVTKDADDRYHFIQPEGDAVVSVSFKAEEKDCPSEKYTDVDSGAWYHQAIDFVLNRAYYNGMSETTFEPDTAMTRAMFVTVLSRMEGIDSSAQASDQQFTDVETGSWYEAAVNWAAANQIVSGIGDQLFDPNGTITREQMAAILYRYAAYKKIDVSGADSTKYDSFKDKADVSSWAEEAVIWATSTGLINGMGDQTMMPKGNSTRAQVAQIIKNYSEKIAGE